MVVEEVGHADARKMMADSRSEKCSVFHSTQVRACVVEIPHDAVLIFCVTAGASPRRGDARCFEEAPHLDNAGDLRAVFGSCK